MLFLRDRTDLSLVNAVAPISTAKLVRIPVAVEHTLCIRFLTQFSVRISTKALRSLKKYLLSICVKVNDKKKTILTHIASLFLRKIYPKICYNEQKYSLWKIPAYENPSLAQNWMQPSTVCSNPSPWNSPRSRSHSSAKHPM